MNKNITDKKTVADFEKILGAYDIITFDIFDTLITRCVLRPVDVFAVVEAQAKHRGITTHSFSAERQKAEQISYQQFGETANYEQIYDVLKSQYSYSGEQCAALMELELETELRLSAPRVAVKDLLMRLLSAGKRIVLCSDMYLSSDAIRKLLTKCGYPGDLELWVSNEKGGTKGSGNLWKQFFEQIPANQKVIHIGDNEQADYRILKQMGKEALLIGSGLSLFEKSGLHGYLSKFDTAAVGHSLILGYLVNIACFNSPFADSDSEDSIISVWGGAAFSCFMDFLVKNRDDSQLLFVTREGYLLKPMYERYCRGLGVEPQCSSLFYSSRAATIAATVTSESDIRNAMQRPEYRGTLGSFVKSRMNYDISEEESLCNLPISIPEQREEVFKLLKPHITRMVENGLAQKKAYLKYISEIRCNTAPLTVVDVGYNGTIQYALSKILSEKVSGLYMFLNDGALPLKVGCACKAIANPRDEDHPVYDNLLFLEAVMQVPYGQVQRLELEDDSVKVVCNSDANFSEFIPMAQELFCWFTEWIAGWKAELGDDLELDFALAEAIWVCLLKFNYLPEKLLESFYLADDFCGNPMWKYDIQKQEWRSGQTITPLAFSLVQDGTRHSLKQKMKRYIKKHIPYFAYDWASRIWVKYIK